MFTFSFTDKEKQFKGLTVKRFLNLYLRKAERYNTRVYNGSEDLPEKDRSDKEYQQITRFYRLNKCYMDYTTHFKILKKSGLSIDSKIEVTLGRSPEDPKRYKSMIVEVWNPEEDNSILFAPDDFQQKEFKKFRKFVKKALL